ncbi:MAG: U32 family peptidase [Oscillospiraceae bacterium]|nr:U32 family peptidase [Oscillospiraceae bacterium]
MLRKRRPQTVRAKPELLAPAGDAECFAAALQFGADAVYVGAKEYGMRAAAKNFDFDALRQAVTLAHAQGVKVYLTANILPRNAEIDTFPAFLDQIRSCGIDAVIAADLGLITMIRSLAPELAVHASTQTGVVNYQTAAALWNMGAERVVLARELSIDEIAEIRAKAPRELELEVFVHGAMCMSVSGRCLLSEYLTGRDANRGACAQSCRWKYALMEEKRPGQYFPVDEDADGSYILNAKDLCLMPYLRELAEAGVDSVKIEGRAKAAYYVAGVTNAYRIALDCLFDTPPRAVPEWVSAELNNVSHRPYTVGFAFGQRKDLIWQEENGYIRDYEVVGIVQKQENGRLYISQRNRFFEGDTVEILMPGTQPPVLTVRGLQNGEGEPIEAANHAVMDCSFLCEIPAPAGAFLRKPVKTGQPPESA